MEPLFGDIPLGMKRQKREKKKKTESKNKGKPSKTLSLLRAGGLKRCVPSRERCVANARCCPRHSLLRAGGPKRCVQKGVLSTVKPV